MTSTSSRARTISALATIALASGLTSTAAAQNLCELSARAEASGSVFESYNDHQNTGSVAGVPIASISASGSTGAAGCSAASQAFASAAYGTLAASGSGTGVNCFTGSATLYSNASLTFRDRIQITHPSLPAGTRIALRLRVAYSGSCISQQPAAPFCLGRIDVTAGLTFGPVRIFETQTGIYEVESDFATVGSFMTLDANFRRDSGVSSGSLQPINGPATPVACSHEALITVTLRPLDPEVRLIACSGHNYAPPCPADFNGDGTVDPDDLSDFITCFFTQPCPQADFNGDGSVDPDDLSDFIVAFFAAAC